MDKIALKTFFINTESNEPFSSDKLWISHLTQSNGIANYISSGLGCSKMC